MAIDYEKLRNCPFKPIEHAYTSKDSILSILCMRSAWASARIRPIAGSSISSTKTDGTGKACRSALHFSIMYSDSPDYAVLPRHGGSLVPVRARWMDPVAFYRSGPPYDSDALANLDEGKKQVQIPFQTPEGKLHPAETRLIWPYPCGTR